MQVRERQEKERPVYDQTIHQQRQVYHAGHAPPHTRTAAEGVDGSSLAHAFGSVYMFGRFQKLLSTSRQRDQVEPLVALPDQT